MKSLIPILSLALAAPALGQSRVDERRPAASDGLVEIEATIFVERDSQKGIVIGKGGGVLKEVGSEARADIEHLLERQVYLSLRVEVRPDWRNDPRTLGELGIG